MTESNLLQLLILVALIGCSSFFSASETALMSLSRIRIRHMAEEQIEGAKRIELLLEKPSKVLGAILVGNNLVNIGAAALATSLAIQYFGPSGIGIATVGMTIIILIFAELTPKTLAAQYSEKTALIVGRVVYNLTVLLHPVTLVLGWITGTIFRAAGLKSVARKPFITEDELKTIVNVSHEEGLLAMGEKEMIHNVVEFGDTLVRDVMVPRRDMVAIELSADFDQVLTVIKEEQYSRIPVYQQTIDNIIGVLYVKDLVLYHMHQQQSSSFKVEDCLRKPYHTFDFIPVTQLFEVMRKNRTHLAIVLDEYGSTAGIVTMEDLVEEIVGDISDEYDHNEQDVELSRENEYVVEGSTKLETINSMLGIEIKGGNLESIGGFVISRLGRLPKAGETLRFEEYNIKVSEMEHTRIKKLIITTKGGQVDGCHTKAKKH